MWDARRGCGGGAGRRAARGGAHLQRRVGRAAEGRARRGGAAGLGGRRRRRAAALGVEALGGEAVAVLALLAHLLLDLQLDHALLLRLHALLLERRERPAVLDRVPAALAERAVVRLVRRRRRHLQVALGADPLLAAARRVERRVVEHADRALLAAAAAVRRARLLAPAEARRHLPLEDEPPQRALVVRGARVEPGRLEELRVDVGGRAALLVAHGYLQLPPKIRVSGPAKIRVSRPETLFAVGRPAIASVCERRTRSSRQTPGAQSRQGAQFRSRVAST